MPIPRLLCTSLAYCSLLAAAMPGVADDAVTTMKPGATFKECRNCPDMVLIPAGKFVMGTPEGQENHEKGWLNRKTGNDDAYRLPSETEWEYAARAGTQTIYPWGEEIDHDYGNFGLDGHELGPLASGRDVWENETAPVGSFPPNGFGLYDMHGNAFEWMEDCYLEDLRSVPSDGSANKNGSCNTRMFRSGSFISNPYMHRSGNRVRGYPPTTRGRNYLTIRVAKTLE